MPELLKQGRCHVVWRWEWNEKRKRWDKPPRQPNGELASVSDPATWVTFDVALAAHQSGQFDGIGVVLTADRELVGIDYDGVVDFENRSIAPEAEATLAELGTYAEVSPSGTGLRLIAKGKLPAGGRRKGQLEMYDSGRYLTLTGYRLSAERNASPEIEDRALELTKLHERVFGSPSVDKTAVPQLGSTIADSKLLELARSWKNGGDFSLLYDHGDWKRYQSQSDADLALCNYLAFATDRDSVQMDRLFRHSGLMRAKWDEKHYSNGQTYGQATLAKALQTVQEGWKPGSGPAMPLQRPKVTEEAPSNPGQQIGIIANLVDMQPTEWVWLYHLPVGMLGILDGDPGDGKSTMVADIAAHITTGTPWYDGTPCPQGAVIIVGAEDSNSHTVVPRLKAAGANLADVLLVSLFEDGKGGQRMPSLPEDVGLFEYTINRMGAKLIVFDPIMPYLAQELSANSDKDVRRALTPLAEMLGRVDCAGLMLRHYAKNDKISSALYRGLGSIGFIGISRFAMAVKREKEDEDQFVLMMSKTNIGPKVKSRRYTIERATLDSAKGPVETSRIIWGEETELKASEMLTAFGGERLQKDIAKDAILEILANGPVSSEDCLAQLAERGVSRDMAWKTKKAMGVQSKKSGFDHWDWMLPPSRPEALKPIHSGGTVQEIMTGLEDPGTPV